MQKSFSGKPMPRLPAGPVSTQQHVNTLTSGSQDLPAHGCHARVRGAYRAHDVSSEHPVCLLVAEDLHHAISVRIGFGSAVGCKGELANSVGNSLKTQSHDQHQKVGRWASEYCHFLQACLEL